MLRELVALPHCIHVYSSCKVAIKYVYTKCLGHLASCVLQRRCRLQCVLFDMLSKCFIVQIAEHTFILHRKRSQNTDVEMKVVGNSIVRFFKICL